MDAEAAARRRPGVELAVVDQHPLAHPTRLLLAVLLLLVSSALLLPAIASILRRVHDRGRGLAIAGAVLATLGALGHAAVAGYYSVLAGAPGGDLQEMTALLDRIDESATAGVVVVPAIAGFALGCFVLVLAMARARLLPRWVALVPLASIAIPIAGLQPWDSSTSRRPSPCSRSRGSACGWRRVRSRCSGSRCPRSRRR